MKERLNLNSVVWALIFAVGFAGGTFVLSRYTLAAPVAALVIAINALLFGVYTVKLIRSLRSLDEVQIRIQLEAVSIAFLLSLLLVMVLGMAGLVASFGLGTVSYLYVFPVLFFFYLIGLAVSRRKYR